MAASVSLSEPEKSLEILRDLPLTREEARKAASALPDALRQSIVMSLQNYWRGTDKDDFEIYQHLPRDIYRCLELLHCLFAEAAADAEMIWAELYDAASVHPIDLPEVLYYLERFRPVRQVGGQLEADFVPGWSAIKDGSGDFALEWQLKQEPLRYTRAECKSVLYNCHLGCVVPVIL